ncbi:MAG: VOC family protein [Candidatus Bathyarchaeota archaeon]|nr:VOC family protein [Candidatus Bathyarchaeota archaeon]
MNGKAGKITRLWLTMIHVSNMDKAVKFYTKTLALPVVLDARIFNHVEVGPDEPLAKIGLHATGKKYKKKRRTGIVFETDDIYALYERLKVAGVRFTLKPTKMPWGGIVADFLDPDKNELEVVQDLEHYRRTYRH